MVRAVLLVPAPGDPHGLLREGPCGARPPVAFCCGCGRFDHAGCTCLHDPTRALVLAWEGEPVPEGCDRAGRVLAALRRATMDPVGSLVEAMALARACEAAGLGTVVIIEAADRAVGKGPGPCSCGHGYDDDGDGDCPACAADRAAGEGR